MQKKQNSIESNVIIWFILTSYLNHTTTLYLPHLSHRFIHPPKNSTPAYTNSEYSITYVYKLAARHMFLFILCYCTNTKLGMLNFFAFVQIFFTSSVRVYVVYYIFYIAHDNLWYLTNLSKFPNNKKYGSILPSPPHIILFTGESSMLEGEEKKKQFRILGCFWG